MHQAVALNILRQLHNILLGICLPEDFVVRVYANIVQCNIPCFVFNAFMPCGQITDNFSCIAIIGINFAKLCIRRAGTFYDFLLFGGAFHSHIISPPDAFSTLRRLSHRLLPQAAFLPYSTPAKSGKWMFSPSCLWELQR